MNEFKNNEALSEISRMKSDIAKIVYGSEYIITLANGRILRITSLEQRPTYSGMMEGFPTKSFNDSFFKSDPKYKRFVLPASRFYGDFNKLIPPDSFLARLRSEDPFEVLPGVMCTAFIRSEPRNIKHNPNDEIAGSHLTLVWFQNEWAFPIAPEVIEKLKVFDWDAHAYDRGLD